MNTIGKRIRQRRIELGLTQRDLGSDGVTYAYISRLEADKRRPSTKALRKLAPKLGVSVHWLETGEDDPAERLAQFVLENRGRPLPQIAASLARKILNSRTLTAWHRPRIGTESIPKSLSRDRRGHTSEH